MPSHVTRYQARHRVRTSPAAQALLRCRLPSVFRTAIHGTAAAIQRRGVRNSKVMALAAAPLPVSHVAQALPIAVTDTTAVTPPRGTPTPTPVSRGPEGPADPASMPVSPCRYGRLVG